MNEHSQLQVLIAKQIMPLAQQLDYLPECNQKEETMENSPHAKEHLQTTLSFLLHGHMNILMSFAMGPQ